MTIEPGFMSLAMRRRAASGSKTCSRMWRRMTASKEELSVKPGSSRLASTRSVYPAFFNLSGIRTASKAVHCWKGNLPGVVR